MPSRWAGNQTADDLVNHATPDYPAQSTVDRLPSRRSERIERLDGAGYWDVQPSLTSVVPQAARRQVVDNSAGAVYSSYINNY